MTLASQVLDLASSHPRVHPSQLVVVAAALLLVVDLVVVVAAVVEVRLLLLCCCNSACMHVPVARAQLCDICV
jgi:hypothetical protein